MLRESLGRHKIRVIVVAAPAAVMLTLAVFLAPLVAATVGVLGAWSVVIIVILWDRWERVEKYGGRLIGELSYLTGRGQRVGLSAEMQGMINGARKDLQAEIPDVMPLPARVRFVRDAEDIAALGEGEIVISLKDPRRRAENTARATLAYVSTAALRPARPYVGRPVMAGIDFSLTKKFLGRADAHALDYFLTEIWAPSVEGRADLQEICDQVERIETRGVLALILLTEFLDLGRRLWGRNPSPVVQSEAREFVRFLADIVDRQPGERGSLEFIREHLRVGVVLVGGRERVQAEGARPYVAAGLWAMRAGCTSIYLLGRGARCQVVREASAQLGSDGRVRAIDVTEYVVRIGTTPITAICAHLNVEQPARSNVARPVTRGHRSRSSSSPPRTTSNGT